MRTFHILDTFCGAGGATRGYQQACEALGIECEITGVDIRPMPRYVGDRFIQADALEYLAQHGHEYDFIHASPPCQRYSVMTRGLHDWQSYPDLIDPVRDLLIAFGTAYVIENVPGAPLDLNCSVMLCGSMFGLQTKAGNQLRRHRWFECSQFMLSPQCQHNGGSVIGVYGGGQNPRRLRMPTIGVYGHSGGYSVRDGIAGFSVADRRDAMGIDWMTNDELSESIPPAYTRYIGMQLFERIGR